MTGACDDCLVRTWLIGRLSPHLELERARVLELLALDSDALLAAVAHADAEELRRELARFDPGVRRAECAASGLTLICRHDGGYPAVLEELEAPPAVLHVAGGAPDALTRGSEDAVAIVGSRAPSVDGLEVARALARGLGVAGVAVISGMASGIDSAAHQGALDAGGTTVAVLAAGPSQARPTTQRQLHSRILERGAAISEFGPGLPTRRWMFPARNRLIAALAGVTIVVEATDRSGALITARCAAALGRSVGAVPGRVTSRRSQGPNGLLAGGAIVVRDVQDVLDELYGFGVRSVASDLRPAPTGDAAAMFAGIADGLDAAGAMTAACLGPGEALAALAALELDGWIRRGPGGSFAVIP